MKGRRNHSLEAFLAFLACLEEDQEGSALLGELLEEVPVEVPEEVPGGQIRTVGG